MNDSARLLHISVPRLALLAGVILSVTACFAYATRDREQPDSRTCRDRFPHLTDDIDCDTIDGFIEQVESTKKKVADFSDGEKKAGRADRISVFYRDLNTRRWFGIDENASIYPASLAKLPIAMMVYKSAEVNPSVLDIGLSVSEDDLRSNDGQRYAGESLLKPGTPYPVRDLIREMLVHSDNAPVHPLLSSASAFKDNVFSELGVYRLPENGESSGAWDIDAKNYANLFRILYNASYLRPDYSERILNELTRSTFASGLTAGVPDGIVVAHKFGEATYRDDGSERFILNDCGIVYRENAPYILCVMTQGSRAEDLERIVSTVSGIVYGSL